jgi:hypothetical protein
LLSLQTVSLGGKAVAPLGQLLEADRARFVRIEQALVSPREPVKAGTGLLILSTLPGVACLCGDAQAVELGKQPLWVCKQATDVLPDGRLDLLGLDVATGARCRTGRHYAVLAVAHVKRPLRPDRCGRVCAAEHRQPAVAARQEAAKQVVVLAVVAKR